MYPAVVLFAVCVRWPVTPEIPKILIIQGQSTDLLTLVTADPKHPAKSLEGLKPDPDIANSLAESLAMQGKSEPIVWNQSDPIFRAAYQSSKIPWISGPVSMDQAEQGAKILGCSGIIFVYAHRGKSDKYDGIYFRASMYKGSRQIWAFPEDPQVLNNIGPIKTKTFEPAKGSTAENPKYKETYKYLTPKLTDVQKQQLAMGNWLFMAASTSDKKNETVAIDSIANTLATSIDQGPFQNLDAQPALPELPVSAGLVQVLSPVMPPEQPESDAALAAAIAKAEAANDVSGAITMAHQGVDAQPMNAKRRELLMTVLQKYGYSSAAVDQAKSAASAFDNSPTLLGKGAEIAFEGGLYDEAVSLANKALTLDPSADGPRYVQAKAALVKSDYETASSALRSVPEARRGSEWTMLTCLWEAMTGDSASTAKLMPQQGALNWTADQSQLATKVIESDFPNICTSFKAIMGKAAAAGSHDGLADELTPLISRASAEQMILSHLPETAAGNKQAIRKALAYNLLLQSLEEVRQAVLPKGSGTLVDARMNLSEAMRQMSLSDQPDEETNHGDSVHH